MNKLFTKIAKLSLGLAMAAGIGVAVASNKKASSVDAATDELAFHFRGSAVHGSNTGYAAREADVTSASTSKVSSAHWQITVGNNSAQLGTNAKSGNLSKTTLGNGSFSAASGVASALEIATTTTKYAAAYCTTAMANITKGELIFTGTNGGNITTAWLLSSTDGSTWTIESNKTSSISTGSTFSVTKSATAKQFAFVCYWNLTNAGGLKGFEFKLYGQYDQTGTITASADSCYSDESVTLTSNATSATWSITSGGSYAHLSSKSGKSVSLIGDAAGSVTVKAVASGYTDATKTITFNARPAGTFYDVTFDSDGGSSSPAKKSIEENETFTFPTPGTKTHYTFAGWSSDGGSTKYATGATSPAVIADIEYTAYWTEDAKVTVTYSAGTNATGSYTHSNQYVGSYSLLALNSLSGITYDSTVYRLKDYVVGGVSKQPGDSITLSTATTVTVNFEEIPLEYQVTFGTADGTTGISDFSNTTIVCPSEVTLDNITGNVYGSTTNAQVALRFGKSGTTGSFDATISGNYYITSVKCNLKYYGSDTTATFAVTPSGGSAISKSLTSSWEDYTYDVSAAKAKTVTLGTDVNGKRAYLSGFTITYAAQKVLSNIALSGTYPTSFTKGDAFSHSGMVVTANYSDSTSATVTSSATWSSPDMSIPGAKTITVSYSDEYGSASQTYSITVNYANPTGITLSQNTKRLALLEEFDVADVEVTINPSATANQSEYEWVVQDEDGLVENDTYVFSDGVFYAMEPADAVVLRCQSTKAGYAATVYADVTVEITGNPIVTLFNANDQDKTNGSESVFTDAGDVTYHVSTENFSGTILYAWSSSDTSVISIDSDNGSSCDFYVEGDEGSARLSCRVTDTASHDVTVYIDVSVEAWSVTSVSWTAPTIDVFSGASLTTSDVSSWNVKYSTNSGKTNQTAPVNSINVKLAGNTISLPHTWVAADNGKTLGVEYEGIPSSTTKVTVTQSINAVYAPASMNQLTKTWTATAATDLGAVIASVDSTDTGEVTFDDDSTMSYERTLEFVASGKADYMAFTNNYIQFGSSNALEKLVLTAQTSGTVTSVVVDCWSKNGGSNLTVTVGGNAFDTSKACPSAGAEVTFSGSATGTVVITMEKSTKTSGLAQYIKSVAITTETASQETTNIANNASHKAAQRAAVAFAQAFNDAMDDTENCTTGLDAAWATCSSEYTSFKSAAAALGETEEAWALNLVKYATAQYSDDSAEACLERMMKTYEICVQKHGKTAFMSDLVTLGAPQVSPLVNIIGENTNTVAIIVIISMVSVTAIGGYFFLRKRKENN